MADGAVTPAQVGAPAAPAPREVDLRVRAGSSVHVRVWRAPAPADRPVLFALHGWTDSSAVMQPLASALAHRWHVVAPDAPGHGGTPWPGGDSFDIEAHVDVAAAALAAVPRLVGAGRTRPPVVVLGHSMGGLTAARLLASAGSAAAHLVLEDPAGTAARRAVTAASGRSWLPGLQRLDLHALTAASHDLNPGWPDDEHEPWAASKLDYDAATLQVPFRWGPPLVEALASLTCPVTMVIGATTRGGIVAPRTAGQLALACRAGAEVCRFPVGHSVRREAREQFLTVLAAVLGRHEG